MKHEIIRVLPGSIADELEITSGDTLLQINGKKIRDVLDYEFTTQAEELLLEIEKPDGEIWELEIEKDSDEDLGLAFKHPLMSEKRRCANKCIFCFIDQQPPGLRPSLYFKDDDPRLSFLHGNYVTLTNLSDAELYRLAGYHLSPLRISVHAADLDLRKKMMGCENATRLFEYLDVFADAGVRMHFQVVLCKGVNDGESLQNTITVLAERKGAESLSVVPAGITRHRDGLYPLEQFTPNEALNVLAQIREAQLVCRNKLGKSFVFAADEWYIIADESLPTYGEYEEFPQLDNGVGMLRLFEDEFLSALREDTEAHADAKNIGIITGNAAAGFMRGLADKFEAAHPTTRITIHAIRNNFLGENITVSGLLTGEDIIAQLKDNIAGDILFIPENAFRVNTETMLDGTTLQNLSAALGIPIKIGRANGGEFYSQLKRRQICH